MKQERIYEPQLKPIVNYMFMGLAANERDYEWLKFDNTKAIFLGGIRRGLKYMGTDDISVVKFIEELYVSPTGKFFKITLENVNITLVPLLCGLKVTSVEHISLSQANELAKNIGNDVVEALIQVVQDRVGNTIVIEA